MISSARGESAFAEDASLHQDQETHDVAKPGFGGPRVQLRLDRSFPFDVTTGYGWNRLSTTIPTATSDRDSDHPSPGGTSWRDGRSGAPTWARGGGLYVWSSSPRSGRVHRSRDVQRMRRARPASTGWSVGGGCRNTRHDRGRELPLIMARDSRTSRAGSTATRPTRRCVWA